MKKLHKNCESWEQRMEREIDNAIRFGTAGCIFILILLGLSLYGLFSLVGSN